VVLKLSSPKRWIKWTIDSLLTLCYLFMMMSYNDIDQSELMAPDMNSLMDFCQKGCAINECSGNGMDVARNPKKKSERSSLCCRANRP